MNPGDDALDQTWRWLTECGHVAFENSDWTGARQAHEGALSEADRLFTLAKDRPPAALLAPMTYTIAAYNLATVHQMLKARQAAEQALWQPIERLLREAESGRPIRPVAIHCLRHWPRAVSHARIVAGCPGFEANLAPFVQRFRARREHLMTAASDSAGSQRTAGQRRRPLN